MKKVLFILSMMGALCANAQRVENVGTITLGLPYEDAIKAMKAEFGEPISISTDEVIYGKKNYQGFSFDEVKFRFKNGKFNEARFFSKTGPKAAAQKKMEDIAKVIGQKYSLSRDFEEDSNSWFYKGGTAPVGVSHLFTICTFPRQGTYGVELRYGPIRFPND